MREPIASMPGMERLSISEAVAEVTEIAAAGIRAVLLFGIPASKDEVGSEAYDDEGVVQMAVRALKEAHPELVVITDVCLCEYTSHGHCGIVREGEVDNDLTLELLAKTAISHAAAGADAVAPSDMMDGRVGRDPDPARRGGPLDTSRSSPTAPSTRPPSTAPSARPPARRPSSATAAATRWIRPTPTRPIREAKLDLEEGADVVMVKPALPYLDVIRRVKDATGAPLAAYHVGGEYSMLKAAAANGWIDERAAAIESLTSIRRAGADMIITYFAKDAAAWLMRGRA